jgi:transposase
MSGQVQAEAGATAVGGQRTKLRRRFAVSEKLRIVEASLAPNASVAGIALAHGVNANLVFKWRRLFQQGRLGRRRPIARLMPVQIAEQSAAEIAITSPAARQERSIRHEDAQATVLRTSTPGTIHIQLDHAQLRIEGTADASTLRVVLEMLHG